jgi:PAS domain S-box-containing protein
VPTEGGPEPEQHVRGRETQEREAAWRRGRRRHSAGSQPYAEESKRADPTLAQHAFAALAENVRDYAIFLMDPDGIIRYWGEGAHLLKRWTREEAEGAHLRLLYIDGGSEDGTAEDHIREAAELGESVSQGHRVRGDGTTFWAHITLTALRDENGTLHGFAKVTRDITVRHAAESALALAAKAMELEASQGQRADLLAELEVLKEELGVLRQELQARDGSL